MSTHRRPSMGLRAFLFVLVVGLTCWSTFPNAFGQTETARLTGRVTDPSGAVVPGADLKILNLATGVSANTASNSEGIYSFPSLMPGKYRITVHKDGFREIVLDQLVLNVQDIVEQNFKLNIGSVTESVTITADALNLNTSDATVSTVVDRQFAENLPMNGRSFQTLIQLTPGVVLTTANNADEGQFSANGQRANANYFMVDGVSANIGMNGNGSGLGQMGGASLPGFSVLGGTNSLVSVDAMQEFRIQTSTYAPEFGRKPGAQISIVTRSGTNQFHGTAFEYLRNDALDANDWFSNRQGLAKSAERINDFGGVIGGPIIRSRTFFFFSYEGQRLQLPQTGITTVPSLRARQSAPAAIQPYLNSFPLPNGADLGNGQARFNAGHSDRSALNATSIRIDHSVNGKLTLFGRYAYSPSDLTQRGANISLSNVVVTRFKTQTLTVGSTWNPKSSLTNDTRFNYSRNKVGSVGILDSFGGAIVPSDSILFPSSFSSGNAHYGLNVSQGQQMSWSVGKNADNVQRQVNLVDSVTQLKGTHSLRFGVDYLWLSPLFGPGNYIANAIIPNVPSMLAGTSTVAVINANRGGTVVFHEFGAFAQDTWRTVPRLTITYGLRWELEPPPSTSSGPNFLAVTGFGNPATLALAPDGTPLWKTGYAHFAPRVGAAYELRTSKGFETLLRGGFGVFYDLATQQVGAAIGGTSFPFGAIKIIPGATFPLTPAVAQPPTISSTPPLGRLVAFDPNLKLPYTLQYNVGLEQSFGATQALSISYVGAAGRRLLQQGIVTNPNPNFAQAALILNSATSHYNALQLQFQRRLSKGLQALASYTWAHSIDDASSDSGIGASRFSLSVDPKINRGPSDFDIRNSFSAALTYDFPAPKGNAFLRAILGGWATSNLIQVRSAPPVDVNTTLGTLFGAPTVIRPDVVPGIPIYLFGPQFPGGRALNPAAFTNPPTDPTTRQATRQGNLGRNALRGFGATQWDFAVRRQFNLRESLHLQFRAEFFNILNHPNFGNPNNVLGRTFFGQSTRMLSRSLGGGGGDGSFSQIYQIGGPRSIQLGLKLQF